MKYMLFFPLSAFWLSLTTGLFAVLWQACHVMRSTFWLNNWILRTNHICLCPIFVPSHQQQHNVNAFISVCKASSTLTISFTICRFSVLFIFAVLGCMAKIFYFYFTKNCCLVLCLKTFYNQWHSTLLCTGPLFVCFFVSSGLSINLRAHLGKCHQLGSGF